MDHDYFGTLDLDDGWIEIGKQLGGRAVQIAMEADLEGLLHKKEVDALARACKEHEALCSVARAKFREEHRELFFDAFSTWIEDDPRLLSILDPCASTLDEVTAEGYESVLSLKEIRLHSSQGDDPGSIVFDFAFNLSTAIDYVVAAYFDLDLALSYVALES